MFTYHAVKDLRSGIRLDVFARSHHDQADGGQNDGQKVPLRSTKDVEDLGEGELPDAADDFAEDADGGREPCFPKDEVT